MHFLQSIIVFVWCSSVPAYDLGPEADATQSYGHCEAVFSAPIFDTDDVVFFQRTGSLQQTSQRQLGTKAAARKVHLEEDFEDIVGLLQHDLATTHLSNSTSAFMLQQSAPTTHLTNTSVEAARESEAVQQQAADMDEGLGTEHVGTVAYPAEVQEGGALALSRANHSESELADAPANVSFDSSSHAGPVAQLPQQDHNLADAPANVSFDSSGGAGFVTQALQQERAPLPRALSTPADSSSRQSAPSPPEASPRSPGRAKPPRPRRPRASLALVSLSAATAAIGSVPSSALVFGFMFAIALLSYSLLGSNGAADPSAIRASNYDVLAPVLLHDAGANRFSPPGLRAAPLGVAWRSPPKHPPPSVFTCGRGGSAAQPIHLQADPVAPAVVRHLLSGQAAPFGLPPLHGAQRPL